jgi:hypothetical protein
MSIEWLGEQVGQMLKSPISSDEECWTQLVPNFCGTRLYNVQTCWGRVWSFIWEIIALFDWDRSCKEQAFLRVAKTVFEVWKEKKEEMQYHLSVFNHYFEQTIQSGYQTEVTIPNEIERKFIDWTFYLDRTFEKEGLGSSEQKISKIDKILKTILGIDVEGSSLNLMNQAQTAHSILKLNQAMQIPYLPSALKMLATNEALPEEGEQALSNFIDQIKALCNHPEKDKKIAFKDLHTTFKAIIKALDFSSAHLLQLEWPIHKALLKQGCNVFFDEDPEHGRWVQRYALHENTEIICEGHPLEVGREITSGKSIGDDKHLVFENDRESVFVFSTCNPAALMLEWSDAQENNWGLPLPALFYINDQYAIYERLAEDPLEGCLNGEQNSDRFQKRYDAIVAFVNRMISERFTPQNLSSNMMRFDQTGNLKFLRMVPKGEFNLEAVYDFIKDCCKNNHPVYYKIIQTACLGKSPRAQMHEHVIPHIIGDVNKLQEYIEEAWSSNQPEKQASVAMAQNLQQQSHALIEACFHQILNDYEEVSENELKQDIGNKALNFLDDSGWEQQSGDLNQAKVIQAVAEFRSLRLKNIALRQKCSDILNWFQSNREKVERIRHHPTKYSRLVKNVCQKKGVYHPQQIAQIESELFFTSHVLQYASNPVNL